MRIDQEIKRFNHRRLNLWRATKLSLANLFCSPFSKISDESSSGGILVLRMDEKLGDSVSATGFLSALRSSFPDQKITVVTRSSFASLYQKLDFVDEALFLKKGIVAAIKILHKLRTHNFKAIVNTSHTLQPGVIFFAGLLASHRKISFGNRSITLFTDHIEIDFKGEHVTERYRKVLELLVGVSHAPFDFSYRLPVDLEARREAVQFIGQLRKKYRFVIILNSFAAEKLRSFSCKTTTGLVRKLLENPEFVVLSIGKKSDQKILDRWIADSPSGSFGGRWIHNSNYSSLEMNLALLAECDLVITPDTAWVHLASALKKKLVAVYRDDRNDARNREQGNPVTWASVVWAPYQTEASVIIAKSTVQNPYEVNSVDIDEVVQATEKMLSDRLPPAMIPFPIQSETRRPAADSAIARQGGATTSRFELEME